MLAFFLIFSQVGPIGSPLYSRNAMRHELSKMPCVMLGLMYLRAFKSSSSLCSFCTKRTVREGTFNRNTDGEVIGLQC